LSEEKEGAKNPVVEALKEAVDKAKLKNLPVTAVMPSSDVVIRCFQMPVLPDKECHKAVVFEAKKYVPFKLEELIFDYSLAKPPKKTRQENMDLVFAAIKKDILNQYVSYLTQAGVRVKTVEPAALSLLRWYKFNSPREDTKTAALLEAEVGSPLVTLTVVKKDIPYFVREISLPNPLILMAGTEVNKDILECLLSEIRISFEYYKKWFQGDKVEKIVLFSQTESLPSLLELLAKEIDMPVESGALRKGVKTKGYLSSELYLANGAALRDTIKSKVRLNFYHRPKIGWFEGKKGSQKALIIEAAVAFLFLMVVYFVTSIPVKFNQTQLKNVISNRPRLEENIDTSSFTALEEAKKRLLKKQETLNTLIKNRSSWTPCLTTLGKLVPNNVWLTDLEFNKKTGETSNSTQFGLLIKAKALVTQEESAKDISNRLLENIKRNTYFNTIFKEISISDEVIQRVGEEQIVVFEISAGETDYSKPVKRRR
jgi:Tfp pilus assembly PilM family ATPase